MRIAIVGAGPAGLLAAILIRRARPDIALEIFEQNPPDATFGFGVVFSDQALGFLSADDPETATLIAPHMKRWSNIDVVHRGERIAIDGVGFAGIGRLELLRLLQSRAAELGLFPRYGARIEGPEHLDADMVIGADGLNSVVRAAAPEAFGEDLTYLGNRFVWYGAAREFDALTQTFIETEWGPMNAHHYAYAPGRATFIIEMSAETFAATGFEALPEPDYRRQCERAFHDALGGAALVPNNSNWRQFPVLRCERFSAGTSVLVGDALHTAHFSIGSGTRLALEDVIALVKALRAEGWNVPQGLAAYQADRAPVLEKITRAAVRSAHWYEEFGTHMAAEPWPFALSYIRRAGRMDAARLAAMAPEFTRQLQARGVDLE